MKVVGNRISNILGMVLLLAVMSLFASQDRTVEAAEVVLVDNSTLGFYNAAIGEVLDATDPLFPDNGSDPSVGPLASAPDISAAATALGGWLSNPAALNSNWSGPQSITSTWTIYTETAIIYEIDAGAGGISNLEGNFGVDNGIAVWVNGVFKFGRRAPGGAAAFEYPDINLGSLPPGQNFIQIIREDSGGGQGYTTKITGNLIAGTPSTFVVNTLHDNPIAVVATANRLLITEYCVPAEGASIYEVDDTGAVVNTFDSIRSTAECWEEYADISPGLGGFPLGQVYVVQGPKIYEFTPAGTLVGLFATVTTAGTDHSGITFDREGTFGHKMIVTASTGHVYTVDSSGNVVFLANPESTEGRRVGGLLKKQKGAPLNLG